MNKKKLVSLCLVLALLITAAIGGTMAYFTDKDSATNTFTSGNVNIDLTEAATLVDEDGNIVEDTEKPRHDVEGGNDDGGTYDYGNLYPAQTVFKDPTIENLGSEDAYIAAKVTITSEGNLHTYTNAEGEEAYLLGISEDYDNIDISGIVSGGLASEDVEQGDYNGLFVYENNNYAVYQAPNKAENTYVLYFFIKAPKRTTEKVVLFKQLSIPANWNNEEMAQLEDLEIAVDAYAVQAYGFDSCFEAMTTAFDNDFDF